VNWRREAKGGLQSLPHERKVLAERYTIDAEEAERRAQLAEEQAARQAEAEEAARQAAEEAARQAAAEEAARQAAAEEVARRSAEAAAMRAAAESARRAAEEEAQRRKFEHEATRRAAEDQAARRAAEEQAARRAAEESAAQAAAAELESRSDLEPAESVVEPRRPLVLAPFTAPPTRPSRERSPKIFRSTAGSPTVSRGRGSVRGSAACACVELRLERAAQELAGHVARPAGDPLWLHPGDADNLPASLSIAARVGVGLADRRCLALRPSAEEREEPPEHSTSVADTRRGD
jgi:hypothetical protein